MKILRYLGFTAYLFTALCGRGIAQATPVEHLSPAEISAAVAAKPNTGFVYIMDENIFAVSRCKAQMPSISLFTPIGWINAMSIQARKQYLPFNPTPEDTMLVLTVVSDGCATGTAAGPVCDSITRTALISDKGGDIVVEAVESHPVNQSWQNGFGARAVCANLVSHFAMSDVQKVRNAKGEFMVAIFSGATLTKTYTVKERFIKKLGM